MSPGRGAGPQDRPGRVAAAVAVGGVLGAEARYGVSLAVPHPPAYWPWPTLLINLLGSALLGVLVASLARLRRPPALARPFLGTGVLGGFTTFSGYELDVHALLRAHRAAAAAAYAVVSVLACVLACVVAGLLTAAAWRRPGRPDEPGRVGPPVR